MLPLEHPNTLILLEGRLNKVGATTSSNKPPKDHKTHLCGYMNNLIILT